MLWIEDDRAQLYVGDVREELATLAPESVHCVVTSPPYWGLRDYGIESSIWGGDAECEHEWGEMLRSAKANEVCGPNGIAGKNAATKVMDKTAGSFCQRCGAWRGALGLEPTPELFVSHLVGVFREVRRVLRHDGVLWLNLGDSYAGSGGAHKPEHANPGISRSAARDGAPTAAYRGTRPASPKHADGADMEFEQPNRYGQAGIKALDLIGVPWRVAFALQADGWYLRSDVVWQKPNPLPESVSGWRWERCCVKLAPAVRTWDQSYVRAIGIQDHPSGGIVAAPGPVWMDCPGCPKCSPTDGYVLRRGSWRPTRSHEYIFMLTKTANYYCDLDAVREPLAESSKKRLAQPGFWDQTGGESDYGKTGVNGNRSSRATLEHLARQVADSPDGEGQGRNLRDVWMIATRPSGYRHFSAFPPELPETCIKASTPEAGVCRECGAPWARVVTRESMIVVPSPNRVAALEAGSGNGRTDTRGPKSITEGWRPTCQHMDQPAIPATVLDPFSGSGTTVAAAAKLGRRGIGIDRSPEYTELAMDRIWSRG